MVDQQRAQGSALADITTGIIRLFRQHYGRGPTKGKTYLMDDRFPYTFTAYAYSVDPIVVLHYANGRFFDVTKTFPKLVSAEAAGFWRGYLKDRKSKD